MWCGCKIMLRRTINDGARELVCRGGWRLNLYVDGGNTTKIDGMPPMPYDLANDRLDDLL
jgi:hypothetical protein